MLIHLGYVAMSTVVKNASPSKTMTATNFSKLLDREAAIRKLERIGAENLHNTLRLLKHNRAHDIMVFRFSSRFIPLIGHEMLGDCIQSHPYRRSLRSLAAMPSRITCASASIPITSPCLARHGRTY